MVGEKTCARAELSSPQFFSPAVKDDERQDCSKEFEYTN